MVRQLFYRMKYCVFFCFEKFPAVLVAMLGSTIPIAILGTKFAMSVTPFWAPIRFSKEYSSRLYLPSKADTSFKSL
jgi:hypothetical protein